MFRPLLARRDILRIGAVGLGANLASAVAADAAGQQSRAKACILIYLDGGPSHIDLFDMRPDAPAEIRGPFRPIATSVPSTVISEHLPLVSQQMHRLLQVRSMRHTETVHDPAVYQMLTGYKHVSSAGGLKVEATDMPHLASAFYQADPTTSVMPKVVQTPDLMRMDARILPGQGSGILWPAFSPLLVPIDREGRVEQPDFRGHVDLPRVRLRTRVDLVDQFNAELAQLRKLASASRLDRFREQALEIVASPQVQIAFDLEREPSAVRDRYGRHRHGQSVLLARRLVEAGTRFVSVYWGNEEQDWADGRGPRLANNPWDTHRNHFPLTKDSLCPRADQALAALIDDLAARGLLETTLVLWMGEFGRTPHISRPWNSRDHWPHAFTILLAGAGVRAGEIYGQTDRHAAEVIDQPVSPADLTATVLATLGVTPHQAIAAADGKPHRLSVGRVMDDWFA